MVSLVVKRGSLVHSDTGSSDCSPHNSVSSCLSVVISLAKLTQRYVVGILQFPGVHGECSIEYNAVSLQGLRNNN